MCVPANKPTGETKLAKCDQWVKDFDFDAFTTDMKKLGDELEKNQGPADVKHLKKMVMWSNACGLVGMLTMGMGVHLLPIIALSTFTFTRWTMIAHHTCHGGYDKIHPNKNRWNRFKFAIGGLWNRMCDWFDWMMPEAWNVEHNNRHHYCLSELEDPDLVENNLKDMRDLPVPTFVKWLVLPMLVTTWKWFYYAPNTVSFFLSSDVCYNMQRSIFTMNSSMILAHIKLTVQRIKTGSLEKGREEDSRWRYYQ